MKKIFLGWLSVALLLGGGSIALADQTVSEGNTGTITVNGTLGADNRSRKATITEGDNDWINVTLPTATIFYSLQKTTAIKSPNYTITNNSGRRLSVSLESFTHVDGSDGFDKIDRLGLKLPDKTISLISQEAGEATLTTEKSELAVLEAGADLDKGDATVPAGATFSYSYEGATKEALTVQSQPNFSLTLKFVALPQ